jgi:hypothetical protein
LNKKAGVPAFFYIRDRRLRADRCIVRAQSVIRADGTPSAQDGARQLELPEFICVEDRSLRALRANPVFGADEKRIRTKNTVMDKTGTSWSRICLSTKRSPWPSQTLKS